MRMVSGWSARAIVIAAPVSLMANAAAAQVAEARDPVRFVEREVAAECPGQRLPRDAVDFVDFTGDGIEDVIVAYFFDCNGVASYFCGRAGCRHDFWAAVRDGYVRTNEVLANEAAVIPWTDGPAVQFDRGPVWVWDGRELALADRRGGPRIGREDDGGSGAGPSAGGWIDPDAPRGTDRDEVVIADGPDYDATRYDPTFDEAAAAAVGVWAFEPRRRGRARAAVSNIEGGLLTIGCRRDGQTMRMAVLPSLERDALIAGGDGDQILTDVLIDGRVVETRLFTRRGDEGPLVEPGLLPDGELLRALRRGSRVAFREAGVDQPIASFRLRGSKAALDDLLDYCR